VNGDPKRPLLRYEVHRGRGPYLLLVHGFLSSRAQWRPNLEALSEVCRPVVVELLGHGRSPSPADHEAYSPASYTEHFEQIREALGAETWCVCGQSLGAALTLRYALSRPERVTAQVFTNSTSALAEEGWAGAVRPIMEAQARSFEEKGRGFLDSHPLNPGRGERLHPEARTALVADLDLHDPRGLAMTGLYTVPSSSVRGLVEANRVPALLVVGEREGRFRDHRRYVEDSMPMLEVAGLDTGHAVNLEDPTGFDAAVTDFIRRHPA
jgi:pimeloyl-ACP methyl ester carboxylesterase